MSADQDKSADTKVDHIESQKSIKELKGVDDALGFALTHDEIEWTEQEERKVIRKIDFRLLPLVLFSHPSLHNKENLTSGCDSRFSATQFLRRATAKF